MQTQTICFVHLFQMYIHLGPADAHPESFYLQPLKSPTLSCWYSKQRLGHSNLGTTVARLCKTAGITGYKTNQLIANNCYKLYQAGVDEQLVMERTGHRSIERVRSYKRTSDDQRRALSNVLNRNETTVNESTAAEQHNSNTTGSGFHGLRWIVPCRVKKSVFSRPSSKADKDMPSWSYLHTQGTWQILNNGEAVVINDLMCVQIALVTRLAECRKTEMNQEKTY